VVIDQTKRRLGWLLLSAVFIALAVVAVDQGAKLVVDARLPIGEWVDVLPVLALEHVHNTGVLLSLFADFGLGVVIVPLAATVAIVVLWVRTFDGRRTTAASFGLILGGALGNLIDRARLGHAIDFLSLHIEDQILFVFNLADVAVMLGLSLLVVYAAPFMKRL